MTLQTPQSVVTTGTTPSPITPTASDTFPVGRFGPNGMFLRVITTGTATNVAILDPGFTPSAIRARSRLSRRRPRASG
jgi:hypothetical protein